MRFDQFSKAILADCLSEAGDVVTQRETSPEPQQIDVWFLPHKGKQQLAIHTRPVLEAVQRTGEPGTGKLEWNEQNMDGQGGTKSEQNEAHRTDTPTQSAGRHEHPA